MQLTVEWSNTKGAYEWIFDNGEIRVCGDMMWGKRMADHYGLEFPQQPED